MVETPLSGMVGHVVAQSIIGGSEPMFGFIAAVARYAGGMAEWEKGVEFWGAFWTDRPGRKGGTDVGIVDKDEVSVSSDRRIIGEGIQLRSDSNNEADEDNGEGVINPDRLAKNADGISHKCSSVVNEVGYVP